MIVHPHVLDGADERDGRLLAGFVPEILVVPLAVLHDFAHRRNGFLVDGVIRILRYEPAVRLDGSNPALFGEVRGLLDMGDARRSRLARNQPNRQRALVEVPHFPSRSANDERSRFDLVFVERLAQASREHGNDFVHEYLARWQAKIVNLGYRIIRIPADAENQAEAQRLLSFVGWYRGSGLRAAEIRYETAGNNTVRQRSAH